MRDDGFVMPLALVVLVAASMMVATSLHLAISDFHANRSARLSAGALYAADAGVQKTLADWGTLPISTLGPGDSTISGWVGLPGGASYHSTVLRVDDGSSPDGLFRVLVEGRPRNSTARRLIVAMIEGGGGGSGCCDAALSVYGRLNVSSLGPGGVPAGRGRGRGGTPAVASAAVDGQDHTPQGWGPYCPTPASAVTGVHIRRAVDLTLAADVVIAGTPDIDVDGALGTGNVRAVASTTYNALAAEADIVFTGNNTTLDDVRPRASGGVCNRNNSENWGAPEAPGSVCWSYLPTIHARGNLTLEEDGAGQGILLVDGDLELRDEFRFHGLVLVLGSVDLRDEARINGGLLIGNDDRLNVTSRVRDEAVVEYGACALARVLPAADAARLLPGRHWFEIP